MKNCCPKCNNEFNIKNIRIEQSQDKDEEIFDVLFECDFCDEETAFARIYPNDLIPCYDD